MTTLRLRMVFLTDGGSEFVITVNNFMFGAISRVSSVMDEIIASNAVFTNSGNLAGKVRASFIAETSETIVLG